MQGDVLLVILLLGFGCAAFLFCVVYMVCQFLAWIGRGVMGVVCPRRTAARPGKRPSCSRPQMCPNDKCRKIEYRNARYCSQCGTRFL